jgi:peptidyl-dipeptidase A
MQTIYASAKVRSPDGRRNLTLDPDLEDLIANSRDYETLAWVWKAWRDAVGPSIKPLFVKLVENMNKAAVENGGWSLFC